MSSNETAAYKIMRSLDVDYVLVIFGGVIGYSGDDINKFLWMVRIAEGEHPKDIRVSHFYLSASFFLSILPVGTLLCPRHDTIFHILLPFAVHVDAEVHRFDVICDQSY